MFNLLQLYFKTSIGTFCLKKILPGIIQPLRKSTPSRRRGLVIHAVLITGFEIQKNQRLLGLRLVLGKYF
jgi:hypothetical protein